MTSELTVADRVREMACRLAGPGAQAEVVVHHSTLALTRFANSAIHQNVADTTTTVRLRLHLDGRTASGSTTITAADGLESLVERTIAATRLSPADRGWPGLTPPTVVPPHGTEFDEVTAYATPEDRASRVRDFVRAAGGLETAGFCRTVHTAAAYANSAGHTVTGRAAQAAMDGIARTGGADGVARAAGPRLSDLDGTVLGGRAAAKARAGHQPIELAPGRYEVVLEPEAVADLLYILTLFSFNGRDVVHGQSFAEPGAAQFDPAITLVDDPAGTVVPFDDEGTPRAALTLVDRGVTAAVAHDRTSAAAAGVVPTGHASPESRTFGPVATYPRLRPAATGVAPPAPGPIAASARPLVGAVRHGLLITDLWYSRVLDKRSLVMTGLTRNGVWLIENGELVAPVGNMRFTQSYRGALAPGAVLGVGGEAVTTAAHWGSQLYSTPALHLAEWNLTGNAAG